MEKRYKKIGWGLVEIMFFLKFWCSGFIEFEGNVCDVNRMF